MGVIGAEMEQYHCVQGVNHIMLKEGSVLEVLVQAFLRISLLCSRTVPRRWRGV